MIITILEYRKFLETKTTQTTTPKPWHYIDLDLYVKVTELDTNQVYYYGPIRMASYEDKDKNIAFYHEKAKNWENNVIKLKLTPQKIEIVDKVPQNANIISMEPNKEPKEKPFTMCRSGIFNTIEFIPDRRKICKNLPNLESAIEAITGLNIIESEFNIYFNERGNSISDTFCVEFDKEIDEMTIATKFKDFKYNLPSGDIIYLYYPEPEIIPPSRFSQMMGNNDVSFRVDEKNIIRSIIL